MARSPKTKPPARQGPKGENELASAAKLAFSVIGENAPVLADIFGDYLSPTGDGGFVVPVERQAEFHQKLAASLTVSAGRTRSIPELLEIARAFHRLGEDDEARQFLHAGFVDAVTIHCPALMARRRFIDMPVAGSA